MPLPPCSHLSSTRANPQVCPYFLSRDLAGSADILFMPYNYLVDSSSRSQLSNINWSNAVVIVDEAHNIQVPVSWVVRCRVSPTRSVVGGSGLRGLGVWGWGTRRGPGPGEGDMCSSGCWQLQSIMALGQCSLVADRIRATNMEQSGVRQR